jgi:hypothetical protein
MTIFDPVASAENKSSEPEAHGRKHGRSQAATFPCFLSPTGLVRLFSRCVESANHDRNGPGSEAAVEAKRHCECQFSGDALRCGDERAVHLLRNALHSAGAYAGFAGNLVDAFTCAQLLLDALFNLPAYARPTQRLTCFYGPL